MTPLYAGPSSPVQEAWLHVKGTGQQQVKPGEILTDVQKQLDEKLALGLAMSKNITSSFFL
jgi:hypothetical protein